MSLRDAFELGSYVEYIYRSSFVLPTVRGERLLLHVLKEMETLLQDGNIGKRSLRSASRWMARLEKKYPKEGVKIENEDAEELAAEEKAWRSEIRSDLDKKPVLEVELQSGLNPDELGKVAEQGPSEFIPAEIWSKMTAIEKSDLSDAAKCLLLGTATPSVMVALRGAEASLRNYYRCKTQDEPGSRSWRQLTRELKNKTKDLGIEDTFIGYLDYIGDAKRNFAQHPNKIYSLREAVMIFMQVSALVEDIYLQI